MDVIDKPTSPIASARKLKFEQLRADYELFLQTFEKPTWLYRLMQRRHYISPYLLNRNLSYLKEKKSTKQKVQQEKRNGFKVDDLMSILHPKEKTVAAVEDGCEEPENYLNLSFAGFFHGPGFAEEIFLTSEPQLQSLYKDDFVKINVCLLKVYHKRKKDAEQPMDVIQLGHCLAPWNPRTQMLFPSSQVKLNIPPSSFAENGRTIRTSILSIAVTLMVPRKSRGKRARKSKKVTSADGKGPPSKKVCSESQTEDTDEKSKTKAMEDENEVFEKKQEHFVATYSAELIVYDRHKNCLLTQGDYELLLQPNEDTEKNTGKSSSWESKFKTKLGPFAAFSFGPTIKFKLSWDKTPLPSKPCSSLQEFHSDSKLPLSNAADTKVNEISELAKSTRIFYQFIYNNSSRKQTEAQEGLQCPWCSLNCRRLYGLLKHLKLFHQRFSILYTKVKNGHRIDVSINEGFESQLDFDGIKDIGFINIDDAPIKRIPQTDFYHKSRIQCKEELCEFAEPDVDEVKLPAHSHGRTYYYVCNNQRVVDNSRFNCRKEDVIAPDWLKEKTQEMIEEFTDVNSGEKELMKLWNLFMLNQRYLADFSVALGCELFVQKYAAIILEKNLLKNFILHLNSLMEFQVISQSAVVRAVELLHDVKPKVKQSAAELLHDVKPKSKQSAAELLHDVKPKSKQSAVVTPNVTPKSKQSAVVTPNVTPNVTPKSKQSSRSSSKTDVKCNGKLDI